MTTQAYQLARTYDPATSHEAAEHMVTSGQLGRDQHKALEAIFAHPGIISGELCDVTCNPGIWKRVSELHRMGLITYGESRVYWASNRKQRSIWPVDGVQRPLPL